VATFIAGGLSDGIYHADRMTAEFAAGIVAPYTDRDGALSLIRNASALNTNHTMALIDRHQSITAPTLVLWGVHDPWQPVSDGERLAREIPGAQLRRVDASHWIPHDTPEEFSAAVLKFLAATGTLQPFESSDQWSPMPLCFAVDLYPLRRASTSSASLANKPMQLR